MLELLVATMLLAVFMTAFVAITEFTVKLVNGLNSDGLNASDLSLARSIGQARLNELAEDLARESSDDFQKRLEGGCLTRDVNWRIKNPVNPIGVQWNLSNQQLSNLPAGTESKGFIERVCIYQSKYSESDITAGLYVLQAEPQKAGPLMQPLRVLICRPMNYCLQ